MVFGNVVQAGNRMNPARQAAIGAGLPVSVPAMTVNRVCGSGAQAIATAADEVRLGYVDIAVAGGMENMDRAPYLMPSGRWGQRMGDSVLYDSMLHDGLFDAFSGEHSGWHTEDLVARYALTREAQDRWAERSQRNFALAQANGRFTGQIAGVATKGRAVRPCSRWTKPTALIPASIRLAGSSRRSPGRHDYRRQCARAQQRRSSHARCRTFGG